MDALAAIRQRRAAIARALEELSSEDRELATTEAVLKRLERGDPRPAKLEDGAPSPAKRDDKRAMSSRPRSQREFVIDALTRSNRPWMHGGEIIAAVKREWNEDIPELSLRPLLTNLKKTRVIVRDGRVIALRERAGEAAAGSAKKKSARR